MFCFCLAFSIRIFQWKKVYFTKAFELFRNGNDGFVEFDIKNLLNSTASKVVIDTPILEKCVFIASAWHCLEMIE